MALNNFFNIPAISNTDAVRDIGINYSLGDPKTLLNEAFQKTSSGAGINFSKLTQNAPTFSELNAAASFQASPDYSLISASKLSPNVSSANSFLNFTGISGVNTSLSGLNLAQATQGGTGMSVNTGITAQALNQSGAVADSVDSQNNYHKIILTSQVDPTEQVIFEVMPEIQEVRSVDYEPLSPPQMPGEFQKYRGTKSTQWTVNGQLTASTRAEAAINYYYVRLLRSWSMPFFGAKQEERLLGAPPPVINFSGWRGLVGQVPCVITAMNWSWPRDVDWLPTGVRDEVNGQEIPFPSIINVNINLTESFSAAQFNSFDLRAFRSGEMLGAYSISDISAQNTVSTGEPQGGNQGITRTVPDPQKITFGVTDDDGESLENIVRTA